MDDISQTAELGAAPVLSVFDQHIRPGGRQGMLRLDDARQNPQGWQSQWDDQGGVRSS